MKTLILYLTRDGQTQRIAQKMAMVLGEGATVLDLRENSEISAEKLAQFDLIIIGASIRYGHFDPLLEPFIKKHSILLNQKKSAFFSVNLTARKANRNTPETNTYTRKLLGRIYWRPVWVEVFAGALRYPRYRWFDRIMIRFIMKITGGETDASREYDYTDWARVSQFAEKLKSEASHSLSKLV